MTSKPQTLSCSLIVPVYNNEGSILPLLDDLEKLDRDLGGDLEVVLVVDGGSDRSDEILGRELSLRRFRSVLVRHTRNFGSFAAIRTGLGVARGPLFAVMAADRQEPVAFIAEVFQALRDEPVDIALGTRTARSDPWLSRSTSSLFWRVYRRHVQPDMPEGGVDVFGCNAAVREQILQLCESNSSLVGLLIWVGFRRKLIPYRRLPRRHGRSGWTFRRKMRYMADSIFAFSDLPVRLLLWTGAFGITVLVLVALTVLVFWLAGRIAVPGYTAIMLAILFSGALITFGLGIVGSYVWRTFENTKRRPQSIVYSVDRHPGRGST